MNRTRIIIYLIIVSVLALIIFATDNLQDMRQTELITTTEVLIDYLQEGGEFELPINGASGYASILLKLYESPSADSKIVATLHAGQGFIILAETAAWWQIKIDGKKGWIRHQYCFVNLPDIIPSIVYDNANAYSSKMKSSGKDIPHITGRQLYETQRYNARLGKDEYTMPVLYAMAKKISKAQQAARADGNTLILYEAFRPYEVQQKIVRNLSELAKKDPIVRDGISQEPWSKGWFIATVISNHQKGYAIDLSLGKIISQETRRTGSYIYEIISEYFPYTMPSEIHELSAVSAIFKSPVSSKSDTEWREAELSDTSNNEALLLQNYCTYAGLTPLASEWWHFNDLDCSEVVKNSGSSGKYFIQNNYSAVPIFQEKKK